MTGTLQAPRLYPAGALLWVLPSHHKCGHGGARSRPGKRPVRLLAPKPSMNGRYHGKEHHELRYVFPEAFEKLLVFKQALVRACMREEDQAWPDSVMHTAMPEMLIVHLVQTDHLPATYARILDETIEQQRHVLSPARAPHLNIRSGSSSSRNRLPHFQPHNQSSSSDYSDRPFVIDNSIKEVVADN